MFDQESRIREFDATACLVPLCGELAGRNCLLRFDDGLVIDLQFLDSRYLLFGQQGSPPVLLPYCCLKSDDLTFFVHIDRSKPAYAPVTLVLDFAGRLVTRIDSGKGSPAILRWFTARPCFGIIDLPGCQPPAERHALTSDLVGSKIEWHYNEFDPITHIYCSQDTFRLSHVPFEKMAPHRQQLHLQRVAQGVDLFEEAVLYIKIRTNKYLVCFIECNMAHVDPNAGGGGILLMDLARVTEVGIFHTIGPDGVESYFPVAAFGRFVYDERPEEKLPSRYKIRYGTDGRQVFPPLV